MKRGLVFQEESGKILVKLNKFLYSKDAIQATISEFKEICNIVGNIEESGTYFKLTLKSICDETLSKIGYGFTNYVLGSMINSSIDDGPKA